MLENIFEYEFALVLSTKLSEEATESVITKFKDLIEANGELQSIDKWGKRRLAYLINKESEGNYILFNFKSMSNFPPELDRISKITEGILRSMIVKKD